MELNPSVVDIIFEGMGYTEGVLRPPSYRRPISSERRMISESNKVWLYVLQELVATQIALHDLTIHEACQEVAIKTGRSYEFIRGHYGDNPGFGKYVPGPKYLRILEKMEHYPLSDEDIIRAIQAVASRSHGLTAHEVCQNIAIQTKRSYEFVRGALDVKSS